MPLRFLLFVWAGLSELLREISDTIRRILDLDDRNRPRSGADAAAVLRTQIEEWNKRGGNKISMGGDAHVAVSRIIFALPMMKSTIGGAPSLKCRFQRMEPRLWE